MTQGIASPWGCAGATTAAGTAMAVAFVAILRPTRLALGRMEFAHGFVEQVQAPLACPAQQVAHHFFKRFRLHGQRPQRTVLALTFQPGRLTAQRNDLPQPTAAGRDLARMVLRQAGEQQAQLGLGPGRWGLNGSAALELPSNF
jgi:hypothetical protein